MKAHAAPSGILSLPDSYNDSEINKLHPSGVALPVLDHLASGRDGSEFAVVIAISCSLCGKDCRGEGGEAVLYAGRYYCDDCTWQLAENGEFQ